MAGLNPSLNRRTGELERPGWSPPRLLMSWEDWLTFGAALIAFLIIAVSIQNAHWVPDMPPLVPVVICGLLIGMLGARLHTKAVFIHPVALVLGFALVLLVVGLFSMVRGRGSRV